MLKRFCFMRLKSAGLLIGLVGSVFSLISAAIFLCAYINVDKVTLAVAESFKSEPNERLHNVICLVVSVQFAINVLCLIADLFLIVGTMKESHLMLTPFLINSGISIVIYGLYVINTVVNDTLKLTSLKNILGSVSFASISFCLQSYIWYGVFSLYHEIRSKREQKRFLFNNFTNSSLIIDKI